MFHDGDLTSGISLAISLSKNVAILVRTSDDSDATEAYDSRIWEEYWLQNLDTAWDELSGPPFGELVREKAVLLRIDVGSREAGFLSQFCPITTAPTLVIIKDGQVLEKLERGISREEFVYRISKAIGLKVEGPPPTTSAVLAESIEHEDTTPSHSITGDQHNADSGADTTSHESAQSSTEANDHQSSRVRQILQERSLRLEADKAAQDAATKAERVERAKARRKEVEDALAAGSSAKSSDAKPGSSTTPSSSSDGARKDWLQQQHQRKQEAKLERERILKQIENDKQNRKARRHRPEVPDGPVDNEPLRTSGAAATASSIRTSSNECSLQIRLFDGSSIRSRFSSEATLAKEVRNWVESITAENHEQTDGPYNFRHVLPPKPSRTIEASEEHRSLRDLDLLPTATLILSPIRGATDAYANSGGGLVGYAYRVGAGVLGYAGQFLPALTRANSGSVDESIASPATSSSNAQSSMQSPRVQTISDQQKDKPSEFYNGNSLGFEGRDDDPNDKTS